MFQEIETLKIFVIFQETELFYISKKGKPNKIIYISGNGTSL